jgi:hypothetical protein
MARLRCRLGCGGWLRQGGELQRLHGRPECCPYAPCVSGRNKDAVVAAATSSGWACMRGRLGLEWRARTGGRKEANGWRSCGCCRDAVTLDSQGGEARASTERRTRPGLGNEGGARQVGPTREGHR